MRMMKRVGQWTGWAAILAASTLVSAADDTLPTVVERFSDAGVTEVPSFQRHVVPLFGRLGCNGRACHGSFQGRGGFRLSLFGYDFQADLEALLDKESPRVNPEAPLESLILVKPTDEDEHEGGKRYEKGGWEYNLFRRWIESGAKFDAKHIDKLATLEVTPNEIVFREKGAKIQLRAVAVWEDGSREDVTPLCRFQSNDTQICEIDTEGLVTGGDAGDTHVVVFYDKAVIPVPVLRPVTDLAGDKYPRVPAPTHIDELVVAKLRKLGVLPSETANDAEFLRRVSLDLTGTLPSAEEVEAFLNDTSPDKRARKIDELLETPGYAAWWTTKLCDFTGNNDDQLVNVTPGRNQASQFWYDWIYKRVANNVPYDQLVEGIVVATSRGEGESYYDYCRTMTEISKTGDDRSFADRPCMPYYWARREFRQAPERAISFAYSFLGVRIECAQCHKHPFDQWSKHDFEEFAKFFGGVTLSNQAAPDGRADYQRIVKELGLGDAKGGQQRNAIAEALRKGKVVPFPEVYVSARSAVNNRNRKDGSKAPPANNAQLLGGDVIDLNSVADPRRPLMDWLRDKSNPYFARAFVNRVWAAYFGVGIVEPPDDHSLANPPSNKALLDYLAQGFIDSGFDMKWVHREILNSRTYQQSWKPNETNESDKRNFARAYIRRLPAEVAYDAIKIATASDEEAAAMRTELANRSITTPGSGTRNVQNRDVAYALTVFGRSTRESNCDCDRSMAPSLLQTVYLQNDSDVLRMIDRSKTGWIDQISRELAPRRDNVRESRGGADLDQLQRQLAVAEGQVARLKKKGDREQLAQAERRLEALRKRVESESERVASSSKSSNETADPAMIEKYITLTYLRTVSRYPTSDELARTTQYIQESESPVEGFRSLIWALINTKEFIVNH